MLTLNGSCGLLLVLELNVGESAMDLLASCRKKQPRENCLPLAQASGIRGNDDVLDRTEVTELAAEICCSDIEENIPDVD